MYRYEYNLLNNEAIYIAGPECFYTHGFDMLGAMRKRAESLGFKVTLPNDHPLDMNNVDLQKRADSIFADLKLVMNQTTVIISDLEAYRGAEPDSGTIYEIGMAYARGIRSYGYTRDKRSLATKNQKAYIKDGQVFDERDKVMPYYNLPFSPVIIGSTKIVEGDFDDCIHTLIIDIEEEYKEIARRKITKDLSADVTTKDKAKPLVYLSVADRYDSDVEPKYQLMKEICSRYGLEAVTPLDLAPGVEKIATDNPYIWAANVFDNYQQHVRNCDIVIADLNDFRGYEISNDVGFECGMGFQLGKKLYGYMDNANPLIYRVPHFGKEKEYRDQTGSNVENFNYPANLMFACSMEIFEGEFEEVIKKVVEDLK